jgi:Major Facilitator Superfamily
VETKDQRREENLNSSEKLPVPGKPFSYTYTRARMGCHFRAEHSGKSLESCSFLEKKSSGSPALLDPASASPANASTDAPPDGGIIAWLQVAASFFVFMDTWCDDIERSRRPRTNLEQFRGIVNTFGAYHTFYQGHILHSHTPSAISWIGSIQGFLLLIVGALTGPLFDAGYTRTLISVGSFLVLFGLTMTSLVKQYYQAFLAQGVCFGIGAGMLFVPSVSIVSTYFDKHRSFAVGVAASGSSLGEYTPAGLYLQAQQTSLSPLISRWGNLPDHISPVATKDRLWLGDSGYRPDCVSYPWLQHCRRPPARPTYHVPETFRYLRAARGTLHTLYRGVLFRLHGPLHPLLLHHALCPLQDWCRWDARVLLGADPQRRVHLWSPRSQCPRRSHRPVQHAHSVYPRLRRARIFMDFRAQHRQPDRIRNSVWFLLRFVRFIAPEHARLALERHAQDRHPPWHEPQRCRNRPAHRIPRWRHPPQPQHGAFYPRTGLLRCRHDGFARVIGVGSRGALRLLHYGQGLA